uniref:Uncharacterized protein n=1 Tax=Rhodopseudomonas palustris (strain BisA53) TaxID=316055 RepID=Q07R16_RHOP5
MRLLYRCGIVGVAVMAGVTALQAQSVRPGTRPEAELLQPAPVKNCSPSNSPSDPSDPWVTASVGAKGFAAEQHFRENFPAGGVAIAWLGATFKQRFIAKTEQPALPTTLQPFHLRRAARASEIAVWLGDRGETTLGDLWCLLKVQPNGEAGALATTSAPNLFFIRDRDGKLWTVDVLWGGPGWEIGASAIDGDRPWDAGAQAFSH